MGTSTGKPRLITALGTFAVLGLLALTTLTGPLRVATLLMLGAFAFKTWIAVLQRAKEENGQKEERDSAPTAQQD